MYKEKYERNNEITLTSLMSEKSVQFKTHGLILSWYVYTYCLLYLGSTISRDGSLDAEINLRTQKASTAFRQS